MNYWPRSSSCRRLPFTFGLACAVLIRTVWLTRRQPPVRWIRWVSGFAADAPQNACAMSAAAGVGVPRGGDAELKATRYLNRFTVLCIKTLAGIASQEGQPSGRACVGGRHSAGSRLGQAAAN